MHKAFDKRKKLHKIVEKTGEVLTVKPLYEDQIPKWVKDHAKSLKLELTPTAIQLLSSYTGTNLERLSKEGHLVFTKADGTSDKMPLKNFFINTSTSEAVNGGGSNVGMSTRAMRMLKSDGSTFKFMIMPANSNGESLVFTYTKQDGSTVTKDITMAA